MLYTVNIEDIEHALVFLGGEAKAKAIQDRLLNAHCAGVIPENYQNERSFRQTVQRKIEDYCPQAEGFNGIKREGKFIRIGHGLYRHAAGAHQRGFLAIEEVVGSQDLSEGKVKKIFVNAYERSEIARKKCIEHYGYACLVCGFDFEKVYGALGKAYTHVHHVKPLAEINGTYVVDPIADLRPLCANCHAMIHRVDPPLSVDKLRSELHSTHNKHHTL